jgi:hypothetical protein
VISAGLTRSVLTPAGTNSTADGQEPSMPDLWDTNPDHVFSPPDGQPNPAPSDPDDHRQEIRLKDDRDRLRLPAYVLIALGIAVVAIAVAIVAVLVEFT